MKKIMICAAAVAMLGLSACSNKAAENKDSLADSVNVAVEEVTAATVDSINPDSAVVNVATEVVETVTPADSAK